MRTFIAIELPENTLDAIRTIQNQLKSQKLNFKWVKPENIHLTLRFLGDINPGQAEDVRKAMEAGADGIGPFRIAPKGLGAFPGLNRPNVVWIGIGGDVASLKILYQGMEDHLEAAGFEKENRPYKGHLTIGRAGGRIDPIRMVEAARQYLNYSADAFTVREVVLFKSSLKPAGAVYEKLCTLNLIP